jgi:hypothetical protein
MWLLYAYNYQAITTGDSPYRCLFKHTLIIKYYALNLELSKYNDCMILIKLYYCMLQIRTVIRSKDMLLAVGLHSEIVCRSL